ncbi:TrkA C-terminal domain-containing protein [Hyperthermus butylicus]
MMPLVMVLLTILFSIIIVRIGTVALMMTGLSRDVAVFQAQSAFTGVGFTTSESEYVVSHPVRRRIIRVLMTLGSAGITTAMASLVLTFVGQSAGEAAERAGWLAIGIAGLYLFSRSRVIDRWMSRVIARMLERFTNLRLYDYEQLLGLSKGYSIAMLKVQPGSWLAGRSLRELKLADEGVLVLGIYRRVNGREVYIGAPRGDTVILEGDTLVCYGPEGTLAGLARRLRGPEGDREHLEAVRAEAKRREEVEKELAVVRSTARRA